ERADLLGAPDGADPADPKSGGQDSADSSRGLRVGYVGQLYRGKGLEVLIPLSRRHPEFEFEVVGGTRDALERLATDKLPSNLSLHGFVPPGVLSEWFERFDVVLMPYQRRVEVAGGRSDASRWMSPLKMFEYMAAGKAIVSSDLPVLREVLEDEENAILVPPEDLDSWSEALQRLDRDPDLRKRLGAAAREALLAHYSWDQRASAVLAGLGTPGR
ncbi:MAG: glycosyltransferase family 4 protein, partial [Thermoanaerobaculia bacterium]